MFVEYKPFGIPMTPRCRKHNAQGSRGASTLQSDSVGPRLGVLSKPKQDCRTWWAVRNTRPGSDTGRARKGHGALRPRPLMCGRSPSLRIERTSEELVNHLASAHPGVGGHQAHTQRRLGGSIPMSHQSSFPWSSAE